MSDMFRFQPLLAIFDSPIQLAIVGMIVLLPLVAVSPIAALMVAVLLGFLWFNAHPARVFMGDMGSHAIGAVAAGAYALYSDVWLLPIAAIIPVAAVLSVVIQVASVRLRKPVVSASILGFDGQVSTFVPFEGPCYRCLFPEPPPAEMVVRSSAGTSS